MKLYAEFQKEFQEFILKNKMQIRVYQAYNKQIAEQAVSLQTFGNNFSLNRMTWIKRKGSEPICNPDWYKITDLTPSVKKWNEQRTSGKTDLKNFPAEKIYPVNNQDILKKLDMI